MPAATARRMWHRFEPVHDVVYFSPTVRSRAGAAGFRGFWMAYFALRCAPLGATSQAVATAVCFGFHPTRVARALPDAWSFVSPDETLAVRLDAVDAALGEILPASVIDSTELARAADLAWTAAQACDVGARPLAAANRALPRPQRAVQALWQATTVLREHRGDGHNAVLLSRGIGPVPAHWLKIAAEESAADLLRNARGYPDEEWLAGRTEVVERGWLDRAGRLTPAGRAEHELVERLTDVAASRPWAALGPRETAELDALLRPLSGAVLAGGLIPAGSPVGLNST